MDTQSTWERSELTDYLRILRRRWVWLLTPLLILPTLAVLLTSSQTPTYTATARVLFNESAAQDAFTNPPSGNSQVRRRLLANEIRLAESDEAIGMVRQQLGLAEDENLPPGTISPGDNADVLIFDLSANDPELAADAANLWANAYVTIKNAEARRSLDQLLSRLDEQIDELRAARVETEAPLERLEAEFLIETDEERRTTLQGTIDREATAIASAVRIIDAQIEARVSDLSQLQVSREVAASGSAQVVQLAVPSDEPVTDLLARNLAVAIALGAILGTGLALVVEYLDRSVVDANDVRAAGLDVLGSIPKGSRSWLVAER